MNSEPQTGTEINTTPTPTPDTTTPRKRGRPRKQPGDPKSPYHRKSPTTKRVTEKGGDSLQRGEKGSVESVESVTTPTPTTQTLPANTPTQTPTGEKWIETLAEREKGVEKVIATILRGPMTAHAQAICRLIISTSDGEFWEDAARDSGLTWPLWSGLLTHYPVLRDLWHEAQASGERFRTQHLEKVTFERATSGWPEPVFHKGEIVGHVQRFSDRMAEIHLRASNPAKYAVASGEGSGGNQVQVVVWHSEPRQPVTITQPSDVKSA